MLNEITLMRLFYSDRCLVTVDYGFFVRLDNVIG